MTADTAVEALSLDSTSPPTPGCLSSWDTTSPHWGPLHTSPPPNVSEAQGPCFPWACAWRLGFAILSQCWVLTTGHLSFGLGLPTCPYHSLDGNSPCWRPTPPPSTSPLPVQRKHRWFSGSRIQQISFPRTKPCPRRPLLLQPRLKRPRTSFPPPGARAAPGLNSALPEPNEKRGHKERCQDATPSLSQTVCCPAPAPVTYGFFGRERGRGWRGRPHLPAVPEPSLAEASDSCLWEAPSPDKGTQPSTSVAQ